MSDSECELRRGGMANSDEQPSEPNRDHEGNLNSPFHFFIDFANKVMACAPTARTIADDFHELPAFVKEEVLKGLVDEIMENLLKGLPELEKEEFFDDCFKALYEKLPWESQVNVANHVLANRPQRVPWPQAVPRPLKPPPPAPAPPPPPPGRFSLDIPNTIGSGNGQGKGQGQGGVKK